MLALRPREQDTQVRVRFRQPSPNSPPKTAPLHHMCTHKGPQTMSLIPSLQLAERSFLDPLGCMSACRRGRAEMDL